MHMQSAIDREVRSIRFSDLRNKLESVGVQLNSTCPLSPKLNCFIRRRVMGSISEVFGRFERTHSTKTKGRSRMSGVRLWPRASRLLFAAAFAGSLMCAHPGAQQSDESFERWAKAHAIQLQT